MKMLQVALVLLPLALPFTATNGLAAGPDGAILIVNSADGPMPKTSSNAKFHNRHISKGPSTTGKKLGSQRQSSSTIKWNGKNLDWAVRQR